MAREIIVSAIQKSKKKLSMLRIVFTRRVMLWRIFANELLLEQWDTAGAWMLHQCIFVFCKSISHILGIKINVWIKVSTDTATMFVFVSNYGLIFSLKLVHTLICIMLQTAVWCFSNYRLSAIWITFDGLIRQDSLYQ